MKAKLERIWNVYSASQRSRVRIAVTIFKNNYLKVIHTTYEVFANLFFELLQSFLVLQRIVDGQKLKKRIQNERNKYFEEKKTGRMKKD